MAPPKRKNESISGTETKYTRKKARTARKDESKAEQGRVKKIERPSPPPSRSNVRTQDVSIFKDEEPAFPRGGGGILTPLEKKEIQNQVNRDVLFDQKNSDSVRWSDSENGMEEDKMPLHSKPRGKVEDSRRSSKNYTSSTNESANVRIESLNPKRIVVGSMLLGQVSRVNTHEVSVALPNNLMGYIPLTGVSDMLIEKIETILNNNESSDDDESSEDFDINLGRYFSVGQYLRVYVTSTNEGDDAAGGGGRRRIELSVNPRVANEGLRKSDLVVNTFVQASPLSIEDHGIVADLGISGVSGFIPLKALGPGITTSGIGEGSVLLCLVTGHGANRDVIKLSGDLRKAGDVKKSNYLSSAPTVNSFLPGVAAEIQISNITSTGITGKIMGMLDVTADFVHSGAFLSTDGLSRTFRTDQKIKGRIVCTFPTLDSKKLGFSLLEHIMSFDSDKAESMQDDAVSNGVPSISSIIPDAKVIKVDPALGLFLDIGSSKVKGFVHISRVSDGKINSLSSSTGPYKIGSLHKARVIGQNSVDGLSILSMEHKVLDQPFLRVEDVEVGAVLKGTVEKLLVGPDGVNGIIVKLSDHISALVPEMHLADALLKHPEKKYREGMTVKGRVLSTNPQKHQIRLTLKKTLVNSDFKIWKTYSDISRGQKSPGTLLSVKPSGAVVQFYGPVKGFLPVAEMSEAYIRDATEHFRPGQVISVFAVDINSDIPRLTLSCKDPASFTREHQLAYDQLRPGMLVYGTVFQKSIDDVLLNLESGLVARLELEHIDDKSAAKSASKLKDIRVGQTLRDLVVLEKHLSRHLIVLTAKPSLVEAAKGKSLVTSIHDVKEDAQVAGFVRNITDSGIFVGFVGGIAGLIPKSHIPDDIKGLPEYGMRRGQSLSATVLLLDSIHERFYLTMKPSGKKPEVSLASPEDPQNSVLEDVVDGSSVSLQDFTTGKLTKAKVTSIKQTQINVVLARKVQGRIHMSEVFDQWEDIKVKKNPLECFELGQILPVRIVGIHDARNHRFLPLTYKAGKNPVFELSARKSMLTDPLKSVTTMEDINEGSCWTCFVNNVETGRLWVNISPIVRGFIRAFDASDDTSLLVDLEKHFPIGSALRASVIEVKPDTNQLILSAKGAKSLPLQLTDLSTGMILPGKVVKILDRQVLVRLSDSIIGAIHLIDMTDDFAEANPASYERNEIIRVSVVHVDVPNEKVMLSTRPSKILSSSLAVKDPEVLMTSQLKPNDIVRGFINRVADNGIFVTLGHKTTGFARVSNLSDAYLKEWQDEFQVKQLVEGKVISVDTAANRVQLNLRKSVLDPNYVPPIEFTDLSVGQIVSGKVVKVENFGVFILVDGSANVRGLSHRSELTDGKVADARNLYEEGDNVKAKVLKLDPTQRRVNFGLKASYFQDQTESEMDEDEADGQDTLGGIQIAFEDDVSDEGSSNEGSLATSDGGVAVEASEEEANEAREAADIQMVDTPKVKDSMTVGFDWTGVSVITAREDSDDVSDEDAASLQQKKRRKRAEIQVDRTGELDANGPQSDADFERLLLGEPDSSYLWLRYMAFQLELSEIDKARSIAERAIRTIGIGQESEKMNIWVALLNLENTYGNDETADEVFHRACEYNDAQEIHEKFASILIGSVKLEKADSVFQSLTKKFSRDPKVWTNYAHFLFNTASSPERGRALLPRALQTLSPTNHVDVTSKFGQLEFSSEHGDPERGRTIFEGLLASFPKRVDLWSVLIDCEIKLGDKEAARNTFERVTRVAKAKLKAKQAKFFFKKWLAFEEGLDENEGKVEEVKKRAEEFVRAQKT